jgi:hypothetical protein
MSKTFQFSKKLTINQEYKIHVQYVDKRPSLS